ncbi:probable serine/threonine-protein kinase At1g09600 [Durio zibethinus]|uniref:Probable serine/threonine-protein kinase At1g09600 n=1 Tax=Durio zibethinus TaxID=66656 RepID=A0A6P5Z629_DURZI|nr:probable serine/threonine-protein kinase At1g09600 [Durio zibethinus]
MSGSGIAIGRRGIHYLQKLKVANIPSDLLEKGQNRVIDASLTLIHERVKLKLRLTGGVMASSFLLGVPLEHKSSFLQEPAFGPPHIRDAIWCGKPACYIRQLLTGLHYCHVNQVLYCDIKDNKGNLKLADFGLVHSFSNDYNANLANHVITLWYRPPELLLEATKYNPTVDICSLAMALSDKLREAAQEGNIDGLKLNKDSYSPIHLALQNEKIVLRLLAADKGLVRVKGREGDNLLHYVAEQGNIHLLAQFLVDCPECV